MDPSGEDIKQNSRWQSLQTPELEFEDASRQSKPYHKHSRSRYLNKHYRDRKHKPYQRLRFGRCPYCRYDSPNHPPHKCYDNPMNMDKPKRFKNRDENHALMNQPSLSKRWAVVMMFIVLCLITWWSVKACRTVFDIALSAKWVQWSLEYLFS